jgi:hypothetical protein
MSHIPFLRQHSSSSLMGILATARRSLALLVGIVLCPCRALASGGTWVSNGPWGRLKIDALAIDPLIPSPVLKNASSIGPSFVTDKTHYVVLSEGIHCFCIRIQCAVLKNGA